jgi:Pilus assembly protein, PilO
VTAALRKLDPRFQIALAAAWCTVLLAAGWFLLITPKRSEATSLAKQADDTQAQIDTNRQLVQQQQHPAEQLRVADLFKLTKAMPNEEDMAGVILQLSRAAEASGVRFTAITPSDITPATGFTKRKISITFIGNFYGLSDFLFRLRNLVAVRGGELEATGRLFTVESVRFDEAPELFPQIEATLDVDVYMYGTPTPSGVGAVPAPPASGDTGSTDTCATTTSCDSSAPPPAGATAAGVSG